MSNAVKTALSSGHLFAAVMGVLVTLITMFTPLGNVFFGYGSQAAVVISNSSEIRMLRDKIQDLPTIRHSLARLERDIEGRRSQDAQIAAMSEQIASIRRDIEGMVRDQRDIRGLLERLGGAVNPPSPGGR